MQYTKYTKSPPGFCAYCITNACSLICPTYGTPNVCSSCPAAVPKNGQNVCSWNAAHKSRNRAAKKSPHYLRSDSSQDFKCSQQARSLSSSKDFQKRITFLSSSPQFVVISSPLVLISSLVISVTSLSFTIISISYFLIVVKHFS